MSLLQPADHIETKPAQIIMVKKRLPDGRPCNKCVQAEQLLKQRGLWSHIDQVLWADENDPASAGMLLATRHNVAFAPFFVRKTQTEETVYDSVLKLVKQVLNGSSHPAEAGSVQPPIPQDKGGDGPGSPPADRRLELESLAELAQATPRQILRWGLERFGAKCAIAFSGAEDVVLIDMATRLGLPFSVFTLDTGRLHPETYRFIEQVRKHYSIEIDLVFPDAERVAALVRKKGLFSFYEDGHGECCSIRKVELLQRTLKQYRAWVTGQRRDQSPTRVEVDAIELDRSHQGEVEQLYKLNPLARLSLDEVWEYIRTHQVPTNELHQRGFVSIGCEPCTRALLPGEHERAGRWWWEEATQRECGLHLKKPDDN